MASARITDLQVLYAANAHFLQNFGRVYQQHLDDTNVLLDVEVGREHTLTEHLVEELRPWCAAAYLAWRWPCIEFPRERQEGRVCLSQELYRFLLGRDARQEVQRGEDGVLEDTGETSVAQDVVMEFS